MAGETEKFPVITSHRPLFAGPEVGIITWNSCRNQLTTLQVQEV